MKHISLAVKRSVKRIGHLHLKSIFSNPFIENEVSLRISFFQYQNDLKTRSNCFELKSRGVFRTNSNI